MCCGNKWLHALIMIVAGVAIILIDWKTTWNLWVIIGIAVIIKAIALMIMPGDKCECESTPMKKKKR